MPRISTMYVMPALRISVAAGRRYPASAVSRRLPCGTRPTGRKRASAPATSRIRGVGRSAYDLLGGKKGPLRVITPIATYSATFGLGYALPLGLRYGLVVGPGFGVALGLEFWLASGKRALQELKPIHSAGNHPVRPVAGSGAGRGRGLDLRCPLRRLVCVFGAMLVLAGFGLQSLQYWAVLLNAPVR